MKWAFLAAGIILLLILLLLFLPIQIRFIHDQVFRFTVTLGFVRVFSSDKQKKNNPKEDNGKAGKVKKKMKSIGSAKEYIELVKESTSLASDLLQELFEKVTVTRLNLKIIVASEDSAKMAIDYGLVTGATANLLAFIEHHMRVKKKQVRIIPDFQESKFEWNADIILRIRVISLRFLLKYLNSIQDVLTKLGF